MKNPQKELQRLLKDPVIAKRGIILVNQEFKTPFIQVVLNSFPGHNHEKVSIFSPDEWVRLVEVMRAYFKLGKKNPKRKEGKNGNNESKS